MRVWSGELEEYPVVGRFVALDQHWISLMEPGRGLHLIAISAIDRLEVGRGKNPAMLLGAIGLGAGIGAVAGAAVPEADDCRLGIAPASECAHETSDALIGAVAGAVVFGLLARRFTKERWVERPLDRVAVGAEGMVLLGLSLRF